MYEKLVYALSHTDDITAQELSHFFIRTIRENDFDPADAVGCIERDENADKEFLNISVSWVRKLAEAERMHLVDKRNEYSAKTAEAAAPKLYGIRTDRYSDDTAQQMLYEPKDLQQIFSEMAFRHLKKRYGSRLPNDRDSTWYQMPEETRW